MIRVGYACMNLTLDLTTNHTTRLALIRNAEKMEGIISTNLSAIEPILRWNAQHDFNLFRLGQSLVPFASHPDFPYDWRKLHGPRMRLIGRLAQELGQRLSMHPGQYITPGSTDAGVVQRSLAELYYVADVLELIGGPDAVMVLHVGGVYGDRCASADRFVAVMREHPRLLRSLALENDERCWNAGEVLDVAERLGVPVILDTLHHRLNPGVLSIAEAFERAAATWTAHPKHGRIKMHISSQLEGGKPGAHADTISTTDWNELTRLVGDREVDVMLEAKLKEGALPLATVKRLNAGAKAA